MILGSLLKKKKHFEVGGEKYIEEELIGEGAFAYVYKVKDNHGKHFALKKMICQTDEQLDEAKKEIKVLLELRHKHILPLHGHSIGLNKAGQNEAYLLLPMYARSLQDVIDSGPGYPHSAVPSPRLAARIIVGCVEAVEALHAKGFRHGDLKPANVLLDEDWCPVLIDFGSVEPLRVEVTSRSQALSLQETAAATTTASFRPPELFDTPSDCVIDGKADVWGLGCLTYALLFSRTPFESPVSGLSTLAVLAGNFTIPPSSPWPAEFHTTIQACLRVDLQARLTVLDLKLVAHLLPQTDSFPVSDVGGILATPAESNGHIGEVAAESFADFAEFPPATPDAAQSRQGGDKRPASNISSGMSTHGVDARHHATVAAEVADDSGGGGFSEWQAAPVEDETEPLRDEDDSFEFGDFVAAAGDPPPLSVGKRLQQEVHRAALSSESSLSSLDAASTKAALPDVAKGGFVFVIRPRRAGLGHSNVKKKVMTFVSGMLTIM